MTGEILQTAPVSGFYLETPWQKVPRFAAVPVARQSCCFETDACVIATIRAAMIIESTYSVVYSGGIKRGYSDPTEDYPFIVNWCLSTVPVCDSVTSGLKYRNNTQGKHKCFPFFNRSLLKKFSSRSGRIFSKQGSIDPGPIFDHDRDRDEKNLHCRISRYPLRFQEGGEHNPPAGTRRVPNHIPSHVQSL